MKRRMPAVCMMLAIIFSCWLACQTSVYAADTAAGSAEQFLYQYNSAYQGIELIKYQGKDSQVSIPAEIEGVPVTAIGADCFYKKRKLAKVIMPNTVISIGDEAFAYCSALQDITWSENLKSIGARAFRMCGIKSLHMPDSLTVLGENAFSDCNFLEEAICPDGLTELNGTFCRCRKLSKIRFPSSPQFIKIGADAFQWCPLKKIEIPASVKEIGDYAFEGSLDKITFPKDSGLEKIGEGAFSRCNFTGVRLPASLKELGRWPFADCVKLKKVLFEKNAKIEKIPYACFAYCYWLREVDIPENVTEIGSDLFRRDGFGYNAVKKIHIKGGKIKKIAKTAFKGPIENGGTITVPKKYQKKYTRMFQKQKWYKKTLKIKAV